MKTFFITETNKTNEPIIIASFSTYEEAKERMIKMLGSFIGKEVDQDLFEKGGERKEAHVRWDGECIVDYKTTYRIIDVENRDFGVEYKYYTHDKYSDMYAGFNSYEEMLQFANLFKNSVIEVFELNGEDITPITLNYDGRLEDLGVQFKKDGKEYLIGVKVWRFSQMAN